MGAMLGVVLSGNLVQLVFFWELTSLFSFLLIGYWHHRADARRGARMALIVTGAGGLALLAGVLVLGHIVGSYDLDAVLASRRRGARAPALPARRSCWSCSARSPRARSSRSTSGCRTRWRRRRRCRPTCTRRRWSRPASSCWRACGRCSPGTEPWFWIVGGAGLATLLLGAYVAMFQNDLKALLAYSTISHLGLITLLLGLNSPLAAVAAVFHMMNHATFKASLFMAAGIVDHETGTRDMRRLDGLVARMPITATLALVASAAMAGVPLLNGFLSKEMFFAETVFVAALPWVEVGLPLAATVAGVFAVVYSLRFGYDIFFGAPSSDLPREPHEPVLWMRVPIELLVLACLIVGIVPEWSIGPVLSAAARPVVGGVLPEYSLAVWHGFTAPFAMSLVALAGGVVVYLVFADALERGRCAMCR